MRSWKRIMISNMNLGISSSSVFSYNLINHFFRFLISIRWPFNEDISHISVLNFFLSNLYFSSTFHLKLSNSLSTFTYNQSYTIIWNWNYICIWRRRSIRCHHTIIHWLVRHDCVIDLCCNSKLFFSNFVSSSIISRYDSLNSILCSSHAFWRISYNEDMLLVIIIRLRCRSFFLGSFTSN